ncbi:hypothetical protein AAFF_G00161160 [Aldrovandia affinis]|uniref:Uncharacterized protein n=1 Tax=Aldrovandia affinis TaxID=143900 RepID=A0AAD7RMW3_9TELE|nr:hypothetical protein AAFF_G00161160 [Aldrovandia affinis]
MNTFLKKAEVIEAQDDIGSTNPMIPLRAAGVDEAGDRARQRCSQQARELRVYIGMIYLGVTLGRSRLLTSPDYTIAYGSPGPCFIAHQLVAVPTPTQAQDASVPLLGLAGGGRARGATARLASQTI